MSDDLHVVALLGTNRKDVPLVPDISADVHDFVVEQSKEAQILYQAVAQQLAQQAGWQPQQDTRLQMLRSQEKSEDRAAEEILPVVDARVVEKLEPILGTFHKREEYVLAEVLTAMQAAGKRFPHHFLASLLERVLSKSWFGKRQAEDWLERLLPTLGERGRWLMVQQSASWKEVVYPTESAEAWQEQQARFATGTWSERHTVLRQLRQRDAEAARDLLATTWQYDTAAHRRKFLETFAVGLSMQDEAFLEQALQDKSRLVRKAAADLLARLPESAYVQRIKARLERLIHPENGDIIIEYLKPQEEIEGIVMDVPKGMTKQDWWLRELVARVPMARFWQGELAPDIVEKKLKKDEKALILEGWLESCLRFHDEANALALWQRHPKNTHMQRLAEIFTAETMQEAAHICLEKHNSLSVQHAIFALMATARLEWTPALHQAFLLRFTKALAQWHKNYRARDPLEMMGLTLPPDFYEALQPLKPQSDKHVLLEVYQEMLGLLELRGTLLKAITQA